MTADMPLVGFGLPVSGSWATPATMVRVARRAEELGYASLWSFQRLLQPVAGGVRTGNPGARPIDDPSYRSVHDPLLPLAYVAGHTERIGLGTATVCAPFTPPVHLAKALASLDQLSGGRLAVGLGPGWLPEEYAAAAVPFARRGARMEEYLHCLHALWTQDPAEFDGEFYTVPRSRTGPAPVQRPHPPVLLGGGAPAALERAGRLAQGWIASTRQDLTRIGDSVAIVREGARAAGRDPGALRVLVRITGDLVDGWRVLDELAALATRGVTEVLVDLNFSPRVVAPDVTGEAALEEAERVLDALAPAQWLSRPRPSA